jgi:hypothetical protein
MMSLATSLPPIPNAIATANAIAPSKIKNLGAVSSTAIPNCVIAANTAYTITAYLALEASISEPVAPLTTLAKKKLPKSAAKTARGLGVPARLRRQRARHPRRCR